MLSVQQNVRTPLSDYAPLYNYVVDGRRLPRYSPFAFQPIFDLRNFPLRRFQELFLRVKRVPTY